MRKTTHTALSILKSMKKEGLSFSQMLSACQNNSDAKERYFKSILSDAEILKIQKLFSLRPNPIMMGGVNLLIMSRMFPAMMKKWIPNFNAEDFIENPEDFLEKAETLRTIERDCITLQMIIPVCRLLNEDMNQQEFNSMAEEMILAEDATSEELPECQTP